MIEKCFVHRTSRTVVSIDPCNDQAIDDSRPVSHELAWAALDGYELT